MTKPEATIAATEDTAKAGPVVVLKTVLEPETKVKAPKAEKSAAKSETKAEALKAGKSAAKSETKVEAIIAGKSASKSETKAETISAEKPASKPKAKAGAPEAEKPASKPKAKAEAAVQDAKPESSAWEKPALPTDPGNHPAVPNPPAISEKPAAQVVDSPLKRMKQEFTERTNVIKQEMRNIQNSFLVIGFQLHWIKTNNMYKVLNYKNIMDYAEKEFGIKKSTCCNFINIIETYAERDENGEVIESIAECYRNFSSSQLIAMIGMPEEIQQQVTPDMSVRAINRLRKGEPETPTVDAPKAVISEAKPTASVPVHEVPKTAVPMSVQEAAKPAAPMPVREAPKPVGTAGSPAANNTGRLLENHVPRTLLEIESYSGYRSAVDKIDKLVKEAFKAGKRMKVKLVCEEG